MAPRSSSERNATNRKKSDRPKTRNLVRWTEEMDKKLLLTLQWACNKRGVKIPWEMVAEEMGTTISAGAVIQHLAKFRSRMVDQGLEVPPALTRGGSNISAKAGKGRSRVQKSRATRRTTNRSRLEADHSGSDDEGDDEDIDKASGSDDYSAKLTKTKGKAKAAKKTRGKKAKGKEHQNETSPDIKNELSLSEKDDLEDVHSDNTDDEENAMQHYAVGDSMWELSGLDHPASEARPVQVQSSSPSSTPSSSRRSRGSSKVVVLQIGQDGCNRLGHLDEMETSELALGENRVGSIRSRDSSDQSYISSGTPESDRGDADGNDHLIAEGDQMMYGCGDGISDVGQFGNTSHKHVGMKGPAMANLAHHMGHSRNASFGDDRLASPATFSPCHADIMRQPENQISDVQDNSFHQSPDQNYNGVSGSDVGPGSIGWAEHDFANHRILGGPKGGTVFSIGHQNAYYSDLPSNFPIDSNFGTEGSSGMHRLATNTQPDVYGSQGFFSDPQPILAGDPHLFHQYPSHWPTDSYSSTESWEAAINGPSSFGNVGIGGYVESPQAMTRTQSGLEQHEADDGVTKIESNATWDTYFAVGKGDRGF
ncbi:MAG: hypothetical protein Q9220_002946 [cf. Caloplaca sp. 1 TL-2023]